MPHQLEVDNLPHRRIMLRRKAGDDAFPKQARISRKAAAHLFGFAFLRRHIDDQPRTPLCENVVEEAVQLSRQFFVEPAELIIRLGVGQELGKAPPRPPPTEFIAGVQLA